MSAWTHAACESCYQRLFPGRSPYRLREPDAEHCCWCGQAMANGIYVRWDPALVACAGDHEPPKDRQA